MLLALMFVSVALSEKSPANLASSRSHPFWFDSRNPRGHGCVPVLLKVQC